MHRPTFQHNHYVWGAMKRKYSNENFEDDGEGERIRRSVGISTESSWVLFVPLAMESLLFYGAAKIRRRLQLASALSQHRTMRWLMKVHL
eukprot:scaffold14885_cov114-Skeletonema_marinoi.AAC.3